MKRRVLQLISILLLPSYLSAAIVVQGDSTSAPFAFTTDITTKAYDPKTGTFFVGLTASVAANKFNISKAVRPTFTTTPVFSAVLDITDPLVDETIEFLAFSDQTTIRDVLVAIKKGSTAFTTNTITALFTDDSARATTSALNDAGGTLTSDGIVQMTANENLIFTMVKPNSSFFGDTNTGVALVGIGTTDTTITVNIKDATTGVDGNKAAPLDKSSVVLKGTGGGQDVVFTDTQAALYWDPVMERLFIGLPIASNALGTDIAKAVVIGRLSSGILNLAASAPDAAISGGGVDEIVVAEGADIELSPRIIRVMHASTGPDYLIVDCAQNHVCNRVFALPLVNDTANPTSATNGTLAKKDSSLSSTFKFTTPATAAGDLPVNNATTNPEAVVGAGDLPIQSSDTISDMVVVGDGVYVAISKAPTASNDSGIWYSQALFDNTGKIIRWTPWTKRIVPLNAFPGITLPGGATHNGSVIFLEIDAKTGNVWLVEGTTSQTVGITNWITQDSTIGLISTADSALSNGCYCVLDLDQATRGFLNTTVQRYALFGGSDRVIFARTSEAIDPATISSPQNPISDYSQAENFLITLLPKSAGCCQVLEYSRTSTTADNDATRTNFCFFFAGTENGLFVFSDPDGAGFNPSTLSTLNVAPFSGRAWRKMDTITGSVIDIKTSGADKTLYVITSESTATTPLKSTLFSIPFTDNTTTMFALGNIHTIAQTGVGVFANVAQFYGVQIVATGDPHTAHPEDKEQLVLATNQGLFRSSASQAGSASIATVTDQATASWGVVAASATKTTATTAFAGIAAADTPVRQTTWPFSIQDESGFLTFNRGSIHQFSGDGNSGGTASQFNSYFIPEKFNANSSSSNFRTLFPIIFFFSDGGRRFFIYNRPSDPADVVKIGVLPFDIDIWNIAQLEVLNNPTLVTIPRFYWIKQIGATGIVMAGTGDGVIGLE